MPVVMLSAIYGYCWAGCITEEPPYNHQFVFSPLPQLCKIHTHELHLDLCSSHSWPCNNQDIESLLLLENVGMGLSLSAYTHCIIDPL